MANYLINKGFIAAAATTQFQAVKFVTDNRTCTPVTGTSDAVLGISQETVATGSADIGKRVIGVAVEGITYARAGGSINPGDRLKVTATGTLIAVTTDADRIVGVSMDTAASGDIFNVLLTPAAQRGTA